ncbi:MAG: universal stress protein [Vicinamibacterales bacterium]
MSDFARVLCPVDVSEASGPVLRYAGALARWYKARLTVLHVMPTADAAEVIPAFVDSVAANASRRERQRATAFEALHRLVKAQVPADTDVEVTVAEDYDVPLEIERRATDGRANLIVMGSEGRAGVDRLLHGSTAEHILDAARHPVLVIPAAAQHAIPPGCAAFKNVLCAVDFSECTLEVVAAATMLAEDADARLTLLNVADEDVSEADTAARLRHLRQLVPESASICCHVEPVVRHGVIWQEVARLASERSCDILVMGASGRGVLSRAVLGSPSHEVLRTVPCPVLFVPRLGG